MNIKARLKDSNILKEFFNFNLCYWKAGDPEDYLHYLINIVPKGRVKKQENNYYFVSENDIYQCGSDPQEFNKFKKFSKNRRAYIEFNLPL